MFRMNTLNEETSYDSKQFQIQKISNTTNQIDFQAQEIEKRQIKKNYISNQYRIASISYCLISCLLGLVIATIEPLKTCNACF